MPQGNSIGRSSWNRVTCHDTENMENGLKMALPISDTVEGKHAPPSTKLMGPSSPIPKVADLDSKAYASEGALVADICESMRTAGGCVIRHLLSKQTLDLLEQEVRPYINAAEPSTGKNLALVIYIVT